MYYLTIEGKKSFANVISRYFLVLQSTLMCYAILYCIREHISAIYFLPFSNNGNAGENHPTPHPTPSINTFANNENIEANYQIVDAKR